MAPKKKTFSKVKAVKTAARVNVGAVKSTRAIPDAKSRAEHKASKFKKPLIDLAGEE